MIRRIFLILILSVCAFAAEAARYTNCEFRFSIVVPDKMKPVEDGKNNRLCYALDGEHGISVYGRKADDGKGYSFRETVKFRVENTTAGAEIIKDFEYAPFYNLLRHSAVREYRNADGFYVKELVTIRSRTCFVVQVFSAKNDGFADRILESVDIDLTHYGYFLLAKNNLGWFWGTLFLTLFPFLGYMTGSRFRKWRRSCGADPESLKWAIFWVAVSAAAFAAEFVMLADDIVLAAIVACVMAVFHVSFAMYNRLVMEVYDSLFGL